MLRVCIGIVFSTVLVLTAVPVHADDFQFIDDNAGALTLRDGATTNILTYLYGDQLAAGVDLKYKRSSYVHPIYSLDGEVLTDDFPADHPHHRGLSWVWPVVQTRGHKTQTWHPGNPPLRQRFVKWLERETKDGIATLSVHNNWVLAESETVASETVTLQVHPVTSKGRRIDLEITIDAVGGPLTLQGTPEGNKGYGGLCLRTAPHMTQAALTTEAGLAYEDIVNEKRAWADLSTTNSGIMILVAQDHPQKPLPWLARNSYAGFLNPCWPGHKAVTLEPGSPVTLRYHLWIHGGQATDLQSLTSLD